MIHYFDRSRMETDQIVARFMSHVSSEPESGCLLWTGGLTGTHKWGYGRFRLNRDTKISAHRLSWLLWRGDIPEGMLVLHTCDKPTCVNPQHLFLGTHKDNRQDCIRKGRTNLPTGCDHYLSKLTPDDVQEIRKLRGVVSQRELARRYNMSYINLGKIQRGQKYGNTLL